MQSATLERETASAVTPNRGAVGEQLDVASSVKFALILTAVLRILYSGFAFFALRNLPVDVRLIKTNFLPAADAILPSEPIRYALLGVWQRFDTVWYVEIARHGYQQPASIVFYPLYPTLIRLLTPLCFGEPIAAALFVSTLSALALFVGLERLFLLDAPIKRARLAVICAAVWPASFILFAGYTEALLIALMVWSIYCARQQSWAAATALVLFAGLAKAVGLSDCIPLFWLAWRSRERRSAIVLFAPIGAVCYWIWLSSQGFPSFNRIYSEHWATQVVAPWHTLKDAIVSLSTSSNPMLLPNLVILAVMVLAVFKTPRTEYKIFALLTTAFLLTKHSVILLESSSRYMLVVFPAFLGVALLTQQPKAQWITLTVCLFTNLCLLAAFMHWWLVV